MDEIELRFETMQRRLQAREMPNMGLKASLQAKGDLMSAKADLAMIARQHARQSIDDFVRERVA